LSEASAPVSFGALRHPGFRSFVLLSSAAMMADNVEHVITYWAAFQKFHSAMLGGFAVISHWLPFLFLSIYTGGLADRFDPRRLIQIGMTLFIVCSISWGVLLATGSLQMWQAMVLLTLHGIAGAIWGPASQVLLYDIVGPAHLQSAVRLNATGRYLGMLLGPAIGSGLLLAAGPPLGMFANALIYLPLVLWLWRAPYGPKFRVATHVVRRALGGLDDVLATLRDIARNPTLVSMTVLGGGAAMLVGNAYQAQMPRFAQDLGYLRAGWTYMILLAADAAGALVAGVVLESRGLLAARPRTAVVLAMCWCGALFGFATCGSYPVAIAFLFAAGFLELSFNSMAQALVQLNAPSDIRGRVIGVYSMASMGLRTFSGISVGLFGGLIGVHRSLSLSAALLCALLGILLAVLLRRSHHAPLRLLL
jgi:MFS family permease